MGGMAGRFSGDTQHHIAVIKGSFAKRAARANKDG